MGKKGWVLSGIAGGVQPLSDRKDSSKTLRHMTTKKLNTSLDMLFIFNP